MTWALSVPCCYHALSTTRQHLCPAHFGRERAAERSSARVDTSFHRLFASSPPTSSYTEPSSPSDSTSANDACQPPGFSIVEEFYACINRRDFDSVKDLIAEDCVYEDLVFPKPFVGRKAIIEFFQKFTAAVSSDLQFVIDDISREDPFCVGVTWHLEWTGKAFPFSKGCSFYRLTMNHGRQQIIYARDCVEPAVKPGDSVLVVIRAVSALLKKFPQLADRF
ncbi:hypothetical protein GOP47_0019662 [Adiantum capillus-veneris]|uniref:SnoaL-like domain-containing protein n=1 Tax=Adiantum capillus-veneris TaxID=13818 RepID=A0A9D4UBX9_ADICA|nr:hypothetical protein GOP47_0019662 [Adiantum capillus-veneris]